MKAASLFSGIGGMDLGLEKAGIEIISQCEKEEYRREVLSEHFKGIKIYTDVSEIYYGEPTGRSSSSRLFSTDKRWRKAWAGLSSSIDLLCGGFPCQDLSIAGKRAGLKGERSGLFYEFARIADEGIKDKGFVLIENVPGLFSSHKGRDFEIIIETLSKCGFNDIAWRVFDSQYFGVPQRRRRVFILARRARGTSCGQILLEPESSGGNFEESSKKRTKDSAISISGLGNGGPDDNDAQAGRIIPALTTRAGNTQDDQQTMQLVTSTLQAHKNGYRLDADSIEQFIPYNIYPERGQGADLVIKETDYAPSLNSTDGAKKTDRGLRIATQIGVRRLTPVECERLQGFPDGWTDINGASDTKRYAALGDAVTVPVAEWIGRRILKYG